MDIPDIIPPSGDFSSYGGGGGSLIDEIGGFASQVASVANALGNNRNGAAQPVYYAVMPSAPAPVATASAPISSNTLLLVGLGVVALVLFMK
jgi:hypothetical protein